MSKPREFCIAKDSYGKAVVQVVGEDFEVTESFHVIEKSAADKLAEALEVQDCKCGGDPHWICDRCFALKEYRGEE